MEIIEPASLNIYEHDSSYVEILIFVEAIR